MRNRVYQIWVGYDHKKLLKSIMIESSACDGLKRRVAEANGTLQDASMVTYSVIVRSSNVATTHHNKIVQKREAEGR